MAENRSSLPLCELATAAPGLFLPKQVTMKLRATSATNLRSDARRLTSRLTYGPLTRAAAQTVEAVRAKRGIATSKSAPSSSTIR